MKLQKFFLPFAICLVLAQSCKDKEQAPVIGSTTQAYSVTDLNKAIVQHNCVAFATGFRNVLNDTNLSYEANLFYKRFTYAALFFDDNSGYVCIENLNGLTISDPMKTNREGQSQLNEKDADSLKITPKLLDIVNYSGGGFYKYSSINPTTNDKENYFTYVSPILGLSAYTKSGFYENKASNLYSQNEINELVVKNGVTSMAKAFGKLKSDFVLDSAKYIKTLRSFLQNIRFFDNQSGYYYILDMNGINIVQPPDPSVQGTNRYDLKDSRGTYLVRGLIDVAKNGGGFYSYYYINYQTNKEQMKKAYISPIPGTNFFLGAGVYLN